MKKAINSFLGIWKYEIRKVQPNPVEPTTRPVGIMYQSLEHLSKLGLKCTSIIDVGAHIGGWSRLAKIYFPSADCFLIEPQIELKADLETFVSDFPSSKYILAGAGAKKNRLTFTVWDDLGGSSFLPKPDEKRKDKQREIEIITIDDLINSGTIKMPDLIKLDIQGYELEALKGAEKTFGNTEVYILEVSLFDFDNLGMPIFYDVVNFMYERGYVVYDFAGFLRRPYDDTLGQCDIIFVKKDGFLRKTNQWE